MVFYDGYMNVRNKLSDADKAFPDSLHKKIMSNLDKIRRLAYEKDDYLFEIRANLENFEDGLTEIFYLAYSESKKISGIDLDENMKRVLGTKCNRFLNDLAKSIEQYETDYKEKMPIDIVDMVVRIKKSLRHDFDIIVDENENLGPIDITCIDSDAILDMYEKVKKMRKGKKKEAEEAKLTRMYEIYKS